MARGKYDRSLDKAQRWGQQRAALHDAMAEVLTTKGARATVAEVCRRAGVGRNTFYAHYRSVAQAHEITIETAEREMQRWLADALDDAGVLRRALDGVTQRPRWATLLVALPEERGLASRFERALTGTLRARGLDRLRSRALSGATRAIALLELDPDLDAALTAILGR